MLDEEFFNLVFFFPILVTKEIVENMEKSITPTSARIQKAHFFEEGGCLIMVKPYMVSQLVLDWRPVEFTWVLY